MRASYNGSMIYDNGKLIGINLGADFAAEHEWGINDMFRYLGVKKDDGFGLSRRKINGPVQYLHWIENEFVGFVLNNFYGESKDWKPRETYQFCDKDSGGSYYAGWSNGSYGSFYVVAKKNNKTTIAKLKEIFDALNDKNACIWLGGGGVFQNAGLCIGIVDRMPKTIFDGWYAHDEATANLKEEFAKTGIEKLLREAKKDWFYLGPKLTSENKPMVNAKGEMLFWLNPTEQRQNNCGWFTLNDLKLWAQDKGPIIMSEEKRKERSKY